MFRHMIKMTKITITSLDGHLYETEGQIQNNKIYIYDEKTVIDAGYIISYTLNNGLQKKCEVINPGYYGDVACNSGFPIYQCTVRDIIPRKDNVSSTISIGTLNNYGNNQIGNNNIQNIETVFTQIIEKIDNAEASEQEKTEAKDKLKEFFKHPLVNTILGGIAGAIITILG